MSASRKPGCHLSSTVKVQWASAASTLLVPALTSCISRYWIRTGRSWLASFLARIDRRFSEHEQHILIGMAKQVSLALDKLAMFEETKRQRQITQEMLDSVQEGIQLLSLNGGTIQVSSTFCELLGCNREQAVSDFDIEAFFAHLQSCTAEPNRLIPYIKAVALGEGDAQEDSIVFELTSPVKRYIQLYAEPLYRNQRKWSTLLVYRDITKEYEIDQMKSEFVSTVSHELRTPLASVLGFAVYPFSTAQETLDAIYRLRPDAVVLDLILQDGESGWKVIEAMQENPELKTIPIVISSAFEEKKKAFDLGAKGYLLKPYHPDTLSKAILLAVTSHESAGQILIPDQLCPLFCQKGSGRCSVAFFCGTFARLLAGQEAFCADRKSWYIHGPSITH